jgi:hypothetical protein
MMQNGSDRQIHELFIQTTAEKLWQCLTDGSVTPNYFFGTVVKSSFEKGAPIRYEIPRSPKRRRPWNGASNRAGKYAR